MKIYKIRDEITGLYSTGGMSPSFNKNGKSWPSKGLLKNHLRMWINCYRIKRKLPDSWKIVEFDLIEISNKFAFEEFEK